MLPVEVRLDKAGNQLELVYRSENQQCLKVFRLGAEYLRVYSPSAEVRGHSEGQAVLQTGKKYVRLTDVEPAGNYALKLIFDDGHDSGLYTWDYLYELSSCQEKYWQAYLQQIKTACASRDPDESVIKLVE